MIPVLYEKIELEKENPFKTQGIGGLADAIACTVEEERNGQYELSMTYPLGGLHYEDLQEENIILAMPNDTARLQPFRIYKIGRPISGKVEVSARHISYQLNKTTVMPFSAGSCAGALAEIERNSVPRTRFKFWTNKTVVKNFNSKKPEKIRALLGGQAGSLLDAFGTGEYEWDLFDVKLWQRRGRDTDISIRYGKNLTDIEADADAGGIYTGIVPFYAGNEVIVTLPEQVLYGEHMREHPQRLVVPVDLTSQFEDTPTVEQLRAAGQGYITKSEAWKINTNIKISFVNLADTVEYKDIAPLERVGLCDTVTVIHEGLGISAKAKVVATKFNVLLERYDSLQLGNTATNLSDVLKDSILDEVPSTSFMQSAIKNATKLLSGGLGGYVVFKQNASGKPEEILVLEDTDDFKTAKKIWRFNKNGLGYSKNGYSGPYELAMTADGAIVASMITAGTMQANRVRGGTLESNNKNIIFDLDSGDLSCRGGLSITSKNFTLSKEGVLRTIDQGKKIITELKSGTLNVYYGGKKIGQLGRVVFEKAGEDKQALALDMTDNANGIALSIGGTPYYVMNRDGMDYTGFGFRHFFDGDVMSTGVFKYPHGFGWGWSGSHGGHGDDEPIINTGANVFVGIGQNYGWLIATQGLTTDGQVCCTSLACSGQKNRVVQTEHHGVRKMYAHETAMPTFSDLGSGEIGEGGFCEIELQEEFAETISTRSLWVMLQGEVKLKEKGERSFTVTGSPGSKFDWMVTALQKGFEADRLEQYVSEKRPIADPLLDDAATGMDLFDLIEKEV